MAGGFTIEAVKQASRRNRQNRSTES